MGSDVYSSKIRSLLIHIFEKFLWAKTIVKSPRMQEKLKLKNAVIIPNGVNLKDFYPINKNTARKKLGWDNRIYILFSADPNRPEKNYKLASAAISTIKDADINLIPLVGIPYPLMNYYYNACDLLLLTSLYEGSPNVIKEALACNCPIVSTNVGDVSERLSGVDGCFICDFKPADVALKIKLALKHKKSIKGRISIQDLDQIKIAKQIIAVYEKVAV